MSIRRPQVLRRTYRRLRVTSGYATKLCPRPAYQGERIDEGLWCPDWQLTLLVIVLSSPALAQNVDANKDLQTRKHESQLSVGVDHDAAGAGRKSADGA